MARRQQTDTYKTDEGDIEITVQALGGIEAGLLGLKLGGILGPALATAAVSMDTRDALGLGSSINALFTKVTPAEFKSLLKEVIAGAQAKTSEEFVDVTMAWLENQFAGCPGSLYKLLLNAIKVNFTNFSQELGLSDDLMAKLKTIATKGAMGMQQPTPAKP